MGIGARLKEAREEKDISLESLQDLTKIQRRYLIAIEEENFSILPGKFYARAFIKEYANAVGLDANELLEEYKEDIPSPDEESTVQYTRISRSRKENSPAKNSQIFSLIPTIIVILLVIGIVFAAWWFFQQSNATNDDDLVEDPEDNEIYRPEGNVNNDTDEEEATEDDEPTQDEETEEGSDPEEQEEEPAAETELILTEEGEVAEFDLINPGEELIFTFEAEDRIWFSVENDEGESFFATFLEPDDSPMDIDLTGEDRIYFNIGYSPNLNITVNGVEFEYPVDPSEKDVQRFWINVNQETE
ncbi:helix-turn-helix domain-containing protein [Ornithinibacillus sp. L9]|uniref:Helix-turn-helix domain-containing protein n=1 Tax=Ornithinibacillus caprae TaxID=2678566 RepID=A0A6N8FN49_9BACI|nr:RodZ domain-containing protein [Ornithinibacillus caprae]MUK89844.1 helix-turn-helix domain-containing protein [Ornithinibacillus caprae]